MTITKLDMEIVCNFISDYVLKYFFLSSVLIFLIFILKKTSFEWILYQIIFYLILLRAKNIMETVVFVGCISYVMEL